MFTQRITKEMAAFFSYASSESDIPLTASDVLELSFRFLIFLYSQLEKKCHRWHISRNFLRLTLLDNLNSTAYPPVRSKDAERDFFALRFFRIEITYQ